MTDVEQAVTMLREMGYQVIPPASAPFPDPVAGQIWKSANARIPDRVVTIIGKGHRLGSLRYRVAGRETWWTKGVRFMAWAEKNNARPC